ncbi:MAG: hypothetical protein MJY98_11490 [Fibrobacter sp.]|nr:hypothetical protein [Fibrobacter sp.]
MNIKLIALASAMAVSAAVAQDYEDEYESTAAESTQEEAAPAEEEPAPAPAAPVYEEPAKEEAVAEAPAPVAAPVVAATGLNVLHGVAYNTVGNEAAASTVRGNMASPYKMAGANLFYVEPSNEYGALAFGGPAMTYLVAFDNRANLGMLTAGIATSGFGVTVDIAIDKMWASNEQKADEGSIEDDYSVTGAGDYLAATFAAPLGALDLTANIYWETYNNEVQFENDDTEHDVDFWNLGARLNISNSPSGASTAWSAGLWFQRHTDYTEDVASDLDGAKTTTERTGREANILIQPYFNIGFPVLGNQDTRVLLGLNTRLPIVFFDELDNAGAKEKDSYSIFALYTTPNIFAEMALTENWIIFGGAAFEWKVFSYASDEFTEDYDVPEDKVVTNGSVMSMKTNNTTATAGARFQYKNLSVEASVADNLGSAAWSGLIGQFSGTLSF